MKIAVFGATGFAGLRLLQAAIDRNIEIKALVRTPDKLGDLADKIEVIQGNYFDREMIFKTIEGTEAVLSTIGPPYGRNHSLKPEDFENGLLNIINKLKEIGVDRIINIASIATSFDGEHIVFSRKVIRFMAGIFAPVMIPSKERELAVLMKSDLNWTSIRVAFITDKAQGKFCAHEHKTMGMRVNVDQLVNFMLDNISSDEWIKKAPFVGTQ